MATVTYSDDTAPYFTVVVSFGGRFFEQLLVSSLGGVELAAMVDGYADSYQREWEALVDETIGANSDE